MLYLIINGRLDFTAINLIAPLLLCSLSIFFIRSFTQQNLKTLIAYLLFFSTSVLTFNEILSPLTGAVNETTNILLFGFPFYTASLAFMAMNTKTPNLLSSFKIANPLLLVTGPVALFVKSYTYRRLHFRINYYLPFFLVGFFLFQIVGAPLVETFELINATDVVGSILFATIFELFVYMNF